MTRQELSQEFDIVYYRTMSKLAQYKRNVLKHNLSSVQGKILPNHKFAQEVIQ